MLLITRSLLAIDEYPLSHSSSSLALHCLGGLFSVSLVRCILSSSYLLLCSASLCFLASSSCAMRCLSFSASLVSSASLCCLASSCLCFSCLVFSSSALARVALCWSASLWESVTISNIQHTNRELRQDWPQRTWQVRKGEYS